MHRGGDMWSCTFFDNTLRGKLNEWKTSSAPAVKHRAIWTWGHVIYDYRNFLDNIARLRLNEIVIWNDCLPLNAEDVVSYAHFLGIKVIWGFAWGWSTGCENFLKEFNGETAESIKNSVLETYEKEYANAGGDGIYFQSFTELEADFVGSKCVAEAVADLVNDVSTALLEKHPNLHIQFGLHATSVRKHLEFIKKVDKRIHIVWKDCGAFPYSYHADEIADFDKTLALTEELAALRGDDEKFGVVLKGMLKLDWNTFEHFSSSYILGERTRQYIRNRQVDKDNIWKVIQAGWLKNSDLAKQTVSAMVKCCKEPVVQVLVEDSMFENKIMFPVAFFAEILWTPDADTSDMTEQVSKYPCVNFANL